MQLDESTFERLVSGLALCVGIEALLVLRDIRGLDLAAAEEVSRWVARSLLHASLVESNAQAKASPPFPPDREVSGQLMGQITESGDGLAGRE